MDRKSTFHAHACTKVGLGALTIGITGPIAEPDFQPERTTAAIGSELMQRLGRMFWEIFKREGGEAIRPLTASELRDQFEITVAQWIDAHAGHDSEAEADGMITDIGEELEERLKELLDATA